MSKISLLACLLLAVSSHLSAVGSFQEDPLFTLHAPIRIVTDAGFTTENGVVGGSGTLEDPYRISGWEIVVPRGKAGIHIVLVTKHFLIEDNLIYSSGYPEESDDGIKLDYSGRNGTIRNNTVRNNWIGIDLVESGALIEGNVITDNWRSDTLSGGGIRVSGKFADSTLIRGNIIAGNKPFGVWRGMNVLLPQPYWSIVNAEDNYWGSPLPPSNALRVENQVMGRHLVPLGFPLDNHVTPTVDTVPWLLAPPGR